MSVIITRSNPDELYHYGVLGMKWGVRRATRALSKAADTESRDKAISNLNTHRAKASKKLDKLQKKEAKLQKKVDHNAKTRDVKAAKMNAKAMRLRRKANGLFVSEQKAANRISKAENLEFTAKTYTAISEEQKAKLVKNQTIQKAFKQGINDIDKALINKGRNIIDG